MNVIYLCIALLSNRISSHISMSNPPSRRNAGSSYYMSQGLVNYNLRSPLNVGPDFFTFPCKGFPEGPSMATFSNRISVTLEGTAVHGGGHCQFGVSYDNSNFLVLRTVLNSCLLDSMTYDFDLPEGAPGGKMTVFWSWVNRVGNREYYMECTDVTINNGNLENKMATLKGTELLVVNLPGYPTIPEWNPGDSPDKDGRNLFYSRQEKTITVNGNDEPIKINLPRLPIKVELPEKERPERPERQKYIKTKLPEKPVKTEQPETIEQVKTLLPKQSDCNVLGKMKCNGKGFDTCVYNKWVYRDCASGTECTQFGEFIICDFAN